MSSTTLLILWFFSPILLRKQYISLMTTSGFGVTNMLCIFSQIPYLLLLVIILAILALIQQLIKMALALLQWFLVVLGKISQIMTKFQGWLLTGDSNGLTNPPR